MTDAQPAQRRRDPEEKRERLLAAARQLFIAQGFDKTTTKQIASTSGVSEGILFHQFGSKVGVLKALIYAFAEGAVAAFTRGELAERTTDVILRRLIDYIEKDQGAYNLILDHPALLRENNIPTVAELIVPEIEKSIRAFFPDDSTFPADPGIMAEFQFSIVEVTCRGWMASGSEAEKEAFFREGVRSMNALLNVRRISR